ncbi:MAG: hypothetical protein ACT4QC_19915 [Planctomycetaceae bacterium]
MPSALLLLFPVVATLLGAPPPEPERRTPAQVQAAKQFAFEGVGIGNSLAAFLEKYPAADLVEAESNGKAGVKCYRVKTLQSADAADYLFLDSVLYEITAFYTPARLTEMGGDTIPYKKLVQKLGPHDKNSPGVVRNGNEESFTAKWDFVDISRRLSFVATAKMSYVSCADTTKASQADQRKTEKAELGF